ncbi:MAG: carboxypeptidase regulatory-like domain-containing protein [Thermoanaerobaculia bacterium]
MDKYRITALCAMALVFGFVACGGDTAPVAEESSQPPATAAPAGNAAINGTINYSNGDPDAAIKMDADPVCAGLHPEGAETQTVVADGGGLANVFVYVKEGISGSYDAPSEPALLDQQGCTYRPHVSGIMTAQTLVIRNSDPTLHNVHALPNNNEEFNQGQPFQDMELEKEFANAEVMVRFKCDVHPWMGAYIGVVDHPFFAVSGADGSFSIGGLPAGDYVLEAWHETLGTQTQSVTVGADGAVDVSFDFSPAA